MGKKPYKWYSQKRNVLPTKVVFKPDTLHVGVVAHFFGTLRIEDDKVHFQLRCDQISRKNIEHAGNGIVSIGLVKKCYDIFFASASSTSSTSASVGLSRP